MNHEGASAADSQGGRYADINGLRMYYEIHGEGGVPLVLLHGGGSTIETTFGAVLPLLAEQRTVVAFEQQGHGRTTDLPERPFTFEQSAEDAVALLHRLGIERADFFGFSNGGNIALRIGITHPGLVRKLVIASAMYTREGVYPEVWEFMRGASLENMPQVLKDAYTTVSPHPERLQSFHDKCAKRMLDFTDWPADDIRSITAPTLVVIGDRDSVRPEHAVEMFRLLPQGRLAVLPGGHGEYIGEASAGRREGGAIRFGRSGAGAHSPQDTVPALVTEMISEFLDSPTL